MFDLGRQLSDLEGKNSKFRRVAFLRIATKNIFMCFQHSPIQTVGGVRENAQNQQKKRKWPWWPWLWPCDLEVIRVGWPCLYLPMIWIWWLSKVIKAVLGHFQCLTLDVHYLTLRAKIQNSASCKFFLWSLRTYLCVFSTLLSKL